MHPKCALHKGCARLHLAHVSCVSARVLRSAHGSGYKRGRFVGLVLFSLRARHVVAAAARPPFPPSRVSVGRRRRQRHRVTASLRFFPPCLEGRNFSKACVSILPPRWLRRLPLSWSSILPFSWLRRRVEETPLNYRRNWRQFQIFVSGLW